MTYFSAGLQFKDKYSSRGYSFSGDEILLCGLFQLHTQIKVGDFSWRDTFGWLQTQDSTGVKLFAQHMKVHWMYLITDNLEYWLPMFPAFAEAVESKLRASNVVIQPGTNRIIGFIDNTNVATSRPGAGPNHRNGHRWDPLESCAC